MHACGVRKWGMERCGHAAKREIVLKYSHFRRRSQKRGILNVCYSRLTEIMDRDYLRKRQAFY